jgi:hypothetical protein
MHLSMHSDNYLQNNLSKKKLQFSYANVIQNEMYLNLFLPGLLGLGVE